MIITNPLLDLIPSLTKPPADRPTEIEAAQAWDSLQSTVRAIEALVGLLEFHDEVVDSSVAAGVIVPHNLKRMPTGYIPLWQDAPRVVYTDKGKWSQSIIRLFSSAGTPRIVFALF